MAQNQGSDRATWVPSLDGVRGYGFLLVFCGHYFAPWYLFQPGTMHLKIATAFTSLALVAVPAFFVLSGYLIGGILYDTRAEVGYFKVFYQRRFLRIFPVYYLTLLAIAIFGLLKGLGPDRSLLAHFLYIQNLSLDLRTLRIESVSTLHFWSLAVEEQFYLLWPVAVWMFKEKRKLIAVASTLVFLCWAFRLAAPLFSFSPVLLLYFTFTRVDAILLGVILALIRQDAIYEQIKPFAKWVLAAGGLLLVGFTFLGGKEWALTYAGEEIWIPLANFMGLALIVAVMEEGSFLNRACSQKWACSLGRLSYSLYVFHLVYSPFFVKTMTPVFETQMRHSLARLVSGALAFVLTLLLSVLTYRWVEKPIEALRRRVRYGATAPTQAIRGPLIIGPGAMPLSATLPVKSSVGFERLLETTHHGLSQGVQRRGNGLLSLPNQNSALHHKAHVFDRADVTQRVSGHGDDVSEIA